VSMMPMTAECVATASRAATRLKFLPPPDRFPL